MNRAQDSAAQRVWRVAVYIRLSKDDGKEESLSVANQRKVIADYLESGFQGRFRIEDSFIDDGESGTDFDRPAFRRMVQAIEGRRIDCIVCKNLSRMFRNYADQGYFLEKVFPKYRIRFITVSEPRIDTFLHPETLDGLEVPISGLMNDRYAAKTSRDVRTTFAAKRRKGEFIGAFAPYGYQKAPEDKNRLLPDPEAARVVRMIYQWFLSEGMSKNGIARRLNTLGIPNPTAYKRQIGLRYASPQAEKNDGLWTARSVSCILQNRVYTGTMVQGRQEVVSYKVHEKRAVPQADWYIVPGTHEAIIAPADFERAQALQQGGGRAVNGKLHLFAGLLRCADCGRAMTRQKSKNTVYYYCRTYRAKSRERCTRHALREAALSRAVLAVLRSQLALAVGLMEIAETLKQLPTAQNNDLQCLLETNQQKYARTEARSDGLYEDWKNGELSHAEYLRLKDRYREQLRQLLAEANEIRGRLAAVPPLEEGSELAFFLSHQDIRALSRGLLTALVKQVNVYENGALEISLCFADPF